MISQNDFMAYEKCRQSGVTNMFDVKMVEFITGLDRPKIFEIMKTYKSLKDQYMPEGKHA